MLNRASIMPKEAIKSGLRIFSEHNKVCKMNRQKINTQLNLRVSGNFDICYVAPPRKLFLN